MPDPNDNPPNQQPAAGRDSIDARRSQGLIGNASGPITQNFYGGDAPAEQVIPACPPPLAGTLIGRDEIVSELTGRLTGEAGVVAICAVRGLPGVGKSDLLRAVGSDARVRWSRRWPPRACWTTTRRASATAYTRRSRHSWHYAPNRRATSTTPHTMLH